MAQRRAARSREVLAVGGSVLVERAHQELKSLALLLRILLIPLIQHRQCRLAAADLLLALPGAIPHVRVICLWIIRLWIWKRPVSTLSFAAPYAWYLSIPRPPLPNAPIQICARGRE